MPRRITSVGVPVLQPKNNPTVSTGIFCLTSVTVRSIRHYKVRCKPWGPGKALDVYSNDKSLQHFAFSGQDWICEYQSRRRYSFSTGYCGPDLLLAVQAGGNAVRLLNEGSEERMSEWTVEQVRMVTESGWN